MGEGEGRGPAVKPAPAIVLQGEHSQDMDGPPGQKGLPLRPGRVTVIFVRCPLLMLLTASFMAAYPQS